MTKPVHKSGEDSRVSKKLCTSSIGQDSVFQKKDSGRGTNVIKIAGESFIDTEGGFLLPDSALKKEQKQDPVDENDFFFGEESTCLECNNPFLSSYLLKHFDYSVCDGCRDNKDKHALITRTDAKNEYLLKDCDLDSREPILKFILRQNPHNVRWGQMKLYLHLQIERRAIEVWGSMEKLEEAHEEKEEKRIKAKAKKYNKNLKALRMEVRSSLFNRISGPVHEHEFGPERYNEEEDTYSRSCLQCAFVETYEKM